MKPISTTPEPLESLRGRYPRALEHVYDAVKILNGGIRPGEVAANVFDFEDGLRLIISRDRMPDGEVVTHVSASFPDKCRIADEFRLLEPFQGKEKLLRKWLESIPRRFAAMSGETRPLVYSGSSGIGIPHFHLEE